MALEALKIATIGITVFVLFEYHLLNIA